MPFSESARATLLKWLNEFLPFTLDRNVERLEELADGFVFAQILRDIDPDYDMSELDKNAAPSTWLSNRRNLQSVYKSLFRYVRREDDPGFKEQHYEYLAFAHDFRAIAENPDAEGLCQVSQSQSHRHRDCPEQTLLPHARFRLKPPRERSLILAVQQLLSVFVAIACSFPNNTRYINLIQKMTPAEMGQIKTMLDEKLAEAKSAEKLAEVEETISGASQAQDPELLAEAQRAAFRQREEQLLKQNADLNGRIEHLQMSIGDMREKNEAIEQELDMLREAHSQNESDKIRSQNLRIKEQEEYIAGLEGHVGEATELKNKLERENHQLGVKAAQAERLQDEVQELRFANEELSKKANTVDRYKQKLESQKGLDSQLKNQQFEIDELKSRLANEEGLQSKIRTLEGNLRRFQDRQQNYELEIVELSSQKRALEQDLVAVRHALESTAEKLTLSEQYIAEMQQELPAGRRQSSDSPHEDAGAAFSLEQELQHTADPTAAYNTEISRLRTENQFLRDNVGAAGESATLRSDLEMATKKHDLMKDKYVEVYDKYAAAQRQLEALKATMKGEGSVEELSPYDTPAAVPQTWEADSWTPTLTTDETPGPRRWSARRRTPPRRQRSSIRSRRRPRAWRASWRTRTASSCPCVRTVRCSTWSHPPYQDP